jgi:hypothetical protein
MQSIDACPTVVAVNAVAREAGKLHKVGSLANWHLEEVKKAVTAKRSALSSPPPVEDVGEMPEAEAEAMAAHMDGDA